MQKIQKKFTYNDIHDFVARMRHSIARQKQQQIVAFQQVINNYSTKQLQDMGLVINNLRVKSTKTGLYGRTLLSLTMVGYSKNKSQNNKKLDQLRLPYCRLGAGDNIGLYEQRQTLNKNKPIINGIVHKKNQFKIVISFEQGDQSQSNDIQNKYLCICSTINQITYNRYNHVLDQLGKVIQDKQHPSKRVLLPLFKYCKITQTNNITPLNYQQILFQDKSLNVQQKKAVAQSLSNDSVYLIHGPPGTGKTKTICQVIRQAVKKGWKVLACAGTNIAIDNIVQRITDKKDIGVCRIGHPSRMIQKVYNNCLDNLITLTSSHKILKQIRQKFQKQKAKYFKCSQKGMRKKIKQQMSHLKYQIRNQQEVAIKEVLQDASVICCTNAGAGEKIFRNQLKNTIFDIVIIDQCAQALQVSCWIPILKGRRLVLAGDHKQLPPTVKSKDSKLLSYTLFDRAMTECPVQSRILITQYRMHQDIMGWSSQQFYQSKLIADESVREHHINGLVNKQQRFIPMMFFDTAGCQMGQNIESDVNDINKSKFNVGQCDLVKIIYLQLINQGLSNKHIGIITPYNAQVNLIKQLLDQYQKQNDTLEISTVDGIQGRQKQCIIISMVRSNPQKKVGFLADQRRMNVAVTRARRFICLIGDTQTVSTDPVLRTLVEYFLKNGDVRSANEFQGDPRVRFGQGYVQRIAKTITTQNKHQYQKKIKKKKKDEQSEIIQKTQQQINEMIKEIPQQQQLNQPQLKNLKRFHQLSTIYRQQIEDFLIDKDKLYISYKHLSAFQRRTMHILAEQYNLDHQTSSDKLYLTLRKKQINKIKKQKGKQQQKNVFAQFEDQQSQDQLNSYVAEILQKKYMQQINIFIEAKKQNQVKSHQIVVKNQKICNLLIDILRKERIKYSRLGLKLVLHQKIAVQKQKQVKPKKKKNQKKVQQQQFDQLKYLQQLQKDQYRCHYKKQICKVNTKVIGNNCQFCNQRFCTRHWLAQEHGCDQAAKSHARSVYLQENKGYGPILKEQTRDYLKAKLNKKNKQAQQNRQKKQKQKK